MSQSNTSLESSRIEIDFGGKKFNVKDLNFLTTFYGFIIAEGPQTYSFSWSQGTTVEIFKQRVFDALDTTNAITSVVTATLWTIDEATHQPHPEVLMRSRQKTE